MIFIVIFLKKEGKEDKLN